MSYIYKSIKTKKVSCHSLTCIVNTGNMRSHNKSRLVIVTLHCSPFLKVCWRKCYVYFYFHNICLRSEHKYKNYNLTGYKLLLLAWSSQTLLSCTPPRFAIFWVFAGAGFFKNKMDVHVASPTPSSQLSYMNLMK